MKIFKTIFILMLVFSSSTNSQDKKQLQFGLLGQDDDVSYLIEKENKTVYEQVKWINLNIHNSLSFGGSYRFQAESFINEGFKGHGSQDNIWYLNRILLHGLLKIGQYLDVYVELASSTAIGKTNVSPVDKDVLAINQAFASYNFNSHWNLIVGRQHLKFGSRRLVDIREGPNVRRSFDLTRLDYKNKGTELTVFFSIPVKNAEAIFDNEYLNFSEIFSGIYLTKKISPSLNFDIYGFNQKDNDVTYNIGLANERRYTLGTRYFGSIDNFNFNNEFVYQIGHFGDLDIRAYTVSINAEYIDRSLADKTVFGIKTELISGDRNPADQQLNTFDALYPRGAYFGRVARFGPSNLIDIHPYINLYKSNYYLEFDYDIFWRYSIQDGVYDAALQLQYPDTNTSAFIGHQIGALIGSGINNHINIELETNLIVPGGFLKKSDLTASLLHTVFTLEYKF